MPRTRNISRRQLLGSATALGIGGVSVGPATAAARDGLGATTQSQRYRLVLNSPSSVRVEYEFAVTGDVWKTKDAGDVLPGADVTIDPEDRIDDPANFDGKTVRGVTQGGVDAYVYAGQIVAFDSTNCGDFNVWVNGTRQPACRLNRNYNADISDDAGGESDGQNDGGTVTELGPSEPNWPETDVHRRGCSDCEYTDEATSERRSQRYDFRTLARSNGIIAVVGSGTFASRTWEAPASGEFTVVDNYTLGAKRSTRRRRRGTSTCSNNSGRTWRSALSCWSETHERTR